MLARRLFSAPYSARMDKRVHPIPKPAPPRHYIKEWRDFRGFTQERLAERVGLTAGAISQLERGLTGYTQPTIEALADALNCEPGDLLDRNPLVEGQVVDLVSRLRHAPPALRQQVLDVVEAMVKAKN